MKVQQLILDKLNSIDFCVKNNIIFYDFFEVNNLSYPKGSKGLSFITESIFNKRTLSFSAHFMENDCITDIIFSAGIEPSFLLSHYLDKTNPKLNDKLIIKDYKSSTEIKFDTYFIFLNEVLYSEEIYKMITTEYWTTNYNFDMWGNYK